MSQKPIFFPWWEKKSFPCSNTYFYICIYKYVHVLSCFSHVWLFATLWTEAHQVVLSMRFSKQEYWSGLPWPPPGHLPDPEIKPASLMSPALASKFFTTSTSWEGHPSKGQSSKVATVHTVKECLGVQIIFSLQLRCTAYRILAPQPATETAPLQWEQGVQAIREGPDL